MHGLWLGEWAFVVLGRRLRAAGLNVVPFSFPSVSVGLDESARRLAHFMDDQPGLRLHAVGHSLGGILIWQAMRLAGTARPGRVVALGTPFAGSHAARRLAAWPGGRGLLGAAMMQWLERPPPSWDLPQPLGVIAGSRPLGMGRLVAPDLPVPNDGAVAVAETLIPGATQRRVLPVSHSGMLLSREVADHTATFLRHGHFPPPTQAGK